MTEGNRTLQIIHKKLEDLAIEAKGSIKTSKMSTYGDGQVGDNTVLLQWASKINSDLNKQQLELLDSIPILNSFIKAFGTGETLVSVGSSVDGSKVNIPRDAGDVDVLIVSGKVKVSERLFEYVPGFPAFLTIPVKEEHLEMFRSVKPVGGGYLPASILQDMEKEWFNLVKVIITSKLLTKSDDDHMRLVRRSKVGFEQQEVTGVRSDLGGILKLPNEKTGRGEGLFNSLTYLNEGVDVIRSEMILKKESGKHVKVTQEGRRSTCKEKRDSYKGVEDIVHLIGDTISKFNSLGDSDSEESEIDCDDVKYDRGAPLIESKINENKEADPVREIGVSKDETSTSNNDISSVCDEKRETLNKEPEFDNVDNVNVKQSAISTQAANSENSNVTLQSNTTRAFDKPIFANDIKNEESDASRKRCTNATGEDTTIEYENIISADYVPAFMFSGWPKPADEWLHRIRKWPTESVKQEVLKTSCQVIVKPLPTKVNSDGTYTPTEEDNVFRLSFASQEVILAHSLNDTQMTCWKILKAFQKSFFETTPRVMTSYLWKNAIFWISEEIDPAFWKQENTLECTIRALDFVLDCLHNNFFPQYFVRDMNLIVQCDAETIVKTTETIKVLKKNPELYLRQFIENPPSPNVVRVTSTDKENLLKSKEKNQDFRVMKVEFLNAFSGIARKMTDEGFVGIRERMRSGMTDTIEEFKTYHEKRHNDKDDVKRRTLLNDTFDSFKGLFESIGDNASKSDDESVIPAPFKKTMSSMLNLVVSGMAKRDNDNTSEKTSAADETSSETRGKRMKMDDFDLD